MDELEKKQLVDTTVNTILPRVQEAISSITNNTIGEKINGLKDGISNELWGKAVNQINTAMQLPAGTIQKLMNIDTLLSEQKTKALIELNGLKDEITAFAALLSGVDLNTTITMTLKDLLWMKFKSAITWLLVGLPMGTLLGLVISGGL